MGLSGFFTYIFEELHGVITPLFRTTCDRVRRGFEKTHQTIGRPEIRSHDLRGAHISCLAENLNAFLTAIKDLLGLCIERHEQLRSLQGNHFAAASNALWGTNVFVTFQPLGVSMGFKSLVCTK